MRKMGGLFSKMRVTAVVMWVGSLALAGVPFFAGFFSKDIILESAFAAHTGAGTYAFWLGLTAALLTAFYSWRLLFLTFHGPTRADHEVFAHAHESPPVMIVPLVLLALGAIFSGWLAWGLFVGGGMEAFWRESILVLPGHETIEAAHDVPEWVRSAPTVLALVGIALAWLMYLMRPDLPGRLAARLKAVYLFLFNKWYFDELYERLIVRPAFQLGRGFWQTGDGAVIDSYGPDGVAAAARNLAVRASRLQSGYIYHYAFAMLIGVVVIVSFYLFFQFG